MKKIGLIIDKYHLEHKISEFLKYINTIADVKIFVEESYLFRSSNSTFKEDIFFVKAKGDLVLSFVKFIEEETSIPVINSYKAIWYAINRFMNSIHLKKAGIPVADFSLNPKDGNPPFKEFIIKNIVDQKKDKFTPLKETVNGFIRVTDRRALNEIESDEEKYQFLYYQKFIKSDWEYKIYGIGENVYFYKQIPVLENPNKIESRQEIKKISELEEYCLKAMEVTGLKITSLDFLKSADDKFYLTDINCTPNFNYIKNGAKIVADYLLEQAKK